MTAPHSRAEAPALGALRVDRIACTGHGACAGILPDAIRLDEWGYPIVDGAGPGDDPSNVAAAVRLCPAMALYLATGV